MLGSLKKLFTKKTKEETFERPKDVEISDSKGQEGFDDVAPIENLQYESE